MQINISSFIFSALGYCGHNNIIGDFCFSAFLSAAQPFSIYESRSQIISAQIAADPARWAPAGAHFTSQLLITTTSTLSVCSLCNWLSASRYMCLLTVRYHLFTCRIKHQPKCSLDCSPSHLFTKLAQNMRSKLG